MPIHRWGKGPRFFFRGILYPVYSETIFRPSAGDRMHNSVSLVGLCTLRGILNCDNLERMELFRELHMESAPRFRGVINHLRSCVLFTRACRG